MVVTSELRLNDVTPLIHATRSPGRVVFLFFSFLRQHVRGNQGGTKEGTEKYHRGAAEGRGHCQKRGGGQARGGLTENQKQSLKVTPRTLGYISGGTRSKPVFKVTPPVASGPSSYR